MEESIRSEDYFSTLILAKKLDEVTPDNFFILSEIAKAYYVLGHYKESLLYMFNIVKQFGHSSYTLGNIATLYDCLGDLRKSELFFRKDIKMNPESYGTYYSYAFLLFQQKKFKQAIKCFKIAFEHDPSDQCYLSELIRGFKAHDYPNNAQKYFSYLLRNKTMQINNYITAFTFFSYFKDWDSAVYEAFCWNRLYIYYFNDRIKNK